ncbi:hypothetical protein [Paramicrobacterium humi]|nr:hypothetical protein [Microbacterium humi]
MQSAAIRTPTILGALVAKAAAYQEILDDPHKVRHLADMLTLAPLMTGRDLRGEPSLKRLEKRRMGNAVGRARMGADRDALLAWFPHDLDDRIRRLARVQEW